MAFTPSTRVHLINVPFDSNNLQVIKFTSKEAQQSYFTGLIISTLSAQDFTYQRRDSIVRVNKSVDDLAMVNYVMYQNSNFTDKWFYAFVTKMEYVSDTVTNVTIETDVYQTWLFNVTINPSFVEREHVSDDTVGLHITEEGLEYGEYVYHNTGIKKAGLNDLCMIVSMTVENVSPWTAIVGTLQDGVYHATAYYYYAGTTAGALALSTMLNALNSAGKADAVVSINMYPDSMILATTSGSRISQNMASASTKTVTVTRKDGGAFYDVGGVAFTPKNNKLYCYPYNLLTVVNRAGAVMKYRYEWFYSDEDCVFKIKANPSANTTVYSIPQNYRFGGQANSDGYNWEEALVIGGYPLCDWNSSVFKNWLAQNAVTAGLDIVGSAVSIGAGLLTLPTGVGGVAVVGGALGIAGVIGQAYEKTIIPQGINGNSNSSDTKSSLGIMDIVYYPMRITTEYMKKLDSYFELFGYKVSEVKSPNLTGRPYWNYVKTIDINIVGGIPKDDMTKLKDLYDKGITLWHTTTGYLDYTLNNH